MAPKSYVLFVFAFVFASNISFSNPCDDYYSKVTYGLNHSKKALAAVSFEHQTYYAERAQKVLEESKAFIAECGCAKTEDKTLDAIESLDKAIDPVDWDAGRFYSKKSIKIINELITLLDECSMSASDTVIEDSEQSTIENEAYSDDNKTESTPEEIAMIQIFDQESKAKLRTMETALQELLSFTKSFSANTDESEDDSNSLAGHKKAYRIEVKQMLEEAIRSLDEKE